MESCGAVEQIVESFVCKNMLGNDQLRVVLSNLWAVLEQGIEGDVVELGCYEGNTSVAIRRLLMASGSDKTFHVYDSFEGLPDKTEFDESDAGHMFHKGQCKTTRDAFTRNFEEAQLPSPVIHEGMFGDIPDDEYPEKIAFAFFDGDFYSSIMDSFQKVYHKLSVGARVTLDDYGYDQLPGVQRACEHFLKGKPEQGTLVGREYIGMMVKLAPSPSKSSFLQRLVARLTTD